MTYVLHHYYYYYYYDTMITRIQEYHNELQIKVHKIAIVIGRNFYADYKEVLW